MNWNYYMKKRKLPRDLNQRAKLIVEIATEVVKLSPKDTKNPNAVALGRLGGLKGGVARAKKLTSEQRKEIAKKAVNARWKKN